MIRRSALVAAALLLSAASAVAADALAPALASLEKGDYAAAAEVAAKVPAEDPLYPRARYLIGECALARGDDAAAAAEFRKVLEKRPGAVPAMVGLGRALVAGGKAEEGEGEIRKALKAEPKDGAAHRALGEALIARRREDDAKKAFLEALKLDRKDGLAARALVELHLRKDEIDLALRVAETLVKADAASPMGYFLRGLALDRKGKDDEAIDAYEKALAKDDGFLDAHKNLAILCTSRNPLYGNAARTKKALAHYARYFELGGRDEGLRQVYTTIRSVLEGDAGER